MDYKIGDKVVYPNHGVGVIEQISYGMLDGRTERYYMLRIFSSGLKVMVPQTNALTVGLRPVMRSGETIKVLSYIEKGKFNSHHDWKHRFKENSERMRTGATSYLEVLDSDTRYFSAQLSLAQAQLRELQSLVQIYRSLGGGWQQ